jgi:hypothetical protein
VVVIWEWMFIIYPPVIVYKKLEKYHPWKNLIKRNGLYSPYKSVKRFKVLIFILYADFMESGCIRSYPRKHIGYEVCKLFEETGVNVTETLIFIVD